MSGISSNLAIDPALAAKEAQDREMVRRKMEIDALRGRLSPEQDPKSKLREACQGFESIFIQKIWEQMRANVPKEGYLHSKQEAMYQSMFDHEFAKKMAAAGGIGLGDMLYEQLAQSLGESSRSAAPRVSPRLPIVPAGSSPGSLRYASGTGPEGSADSIGQNGAPLNLPNGNIRPLYENLDENADQQPFVLPGRGGNPGEYAAMDISRHRPLSVQQAQAAAEYKASRAEANAGAYMADQAEAMDLTVRPLDFEALSQEALRQEAAQGNLHTEASENSAARPVSAYALAFNRRHSASSILSPEETRILREALRENAGSAFSDGQPVGTDS